MILKKFYGSTIQEALREAKEKLGEQVILLESVPPEDDRQAAVTVMLDEKLQSTEPVPAEAEETEFRNVFYKRSDVRKKKAPAQSAPASPSGDSRNGADLKKQDKDTSESKQQDQPAKQPRSAQEQTEKKKSEQAPTKEKASEKQSAKQAKDDKRSPDLKARRKKAKQDPPDQQEQDELPEPKGLDERMSRHDRSLLEHTDDLPKQQAPQGYYKDSSVSREVSALHRRFDQVESMLSDALISANLDYAAHPAFQQLVQTGIRATTVSGWFKEILNKGIDPFEERESFMYELARIVRNALTITLPKAAQPNMVFVGPSGSGKTTLIMKLARNLEFFGDQEVAIVSVEPRNRPVPYTILKPYAEDHNLDFYTVRDGIDVSKLMPKLVNYDQVLFDTPSISLEKKTAFREYWKIRQILASVLPLEVHFVINATMENYYFREAYATNHPLQPDYVAITHLDETDRWGHLIPFLKTLGCSVRYMSLGPSVPDDVDAFSPTWFAEKILST
jgi:flagellar biosynthesis protein FlhF